MGEDRTEHDHLFKKLLTVFFFEFIDLFLPELAAYIRRDPPEFLDKELFTDLNAGERKEVDLVAKVRFLADEAFLIIHVENQGQPRRGFVRRVFHYFAHLDEKFDLPIYPIALLSYDAPQRPEPDSYVVEFPDRKVLDFSLRVIQLNRLNWRDYLRTPNPVAAALMTKMKIAPEDRPKVKLECVRMIATLRLDPKKARVIGDFLEAYLTLNAEETKSYNEELESTNPTERKAIMTIIGQYSGTGMQKIILIFLGHRFGPLSDQLVKRIEYVPYHHLEELGKAMGDFKSLADLEAWLTVHN